MERVENREELINKLKDLKAILNDKFGIEEFGIFGSFARGENKQDSDIDIVILKIKKKGFFILFEAKKFLSEQLKRKVDLGTYDGMREFVKNQIIKDLVYV